MEENEEPPIYHHDLWSCFISWSRRDALWIFLQPTLKPHGELTPNSSHGKHFIEPCVGPPRGLICTSHFLPIFEDDLNFLSYIHARALVGARCSTSWESNKSSSECECSLDLWCNLYKLILHKLSGNKWKLKNFYENNIQWKNTLQN